MASHSSPTAPPDAPAPRRPRRWVRALLTLISLGIAAFWIWALFFPPKGSVAKLEDTAWTERADAICREANTARNELADTRRISEAGPNALAERADLIDQATDIVEQMVDDLVSVAPVGVEDPELVAVWESYYRALIVNRRDYAEVLRTGENPPFRESALDGVPVSEFINDFTVANRMKACSAPADLSV